MCDHLHGTGQKGWWVHVGRQLLDVTSDGQRMECDYVPYNMDMSAICTTAFDGSYWRFHLPGAQGKRVFLHRQLYEDIVSGALVPNGQDVHHTLGVHNNVLSSLELQDSGPHRRGHRRQRRRIR